MYNGARARARNNKIFVLTVVQEGIILIRPHDLEHDNHVYTTSIKTLLLINGNPSSPSVRVRSFNRVGIYYIAL